MDKHRTKNSDTLQNSQDSSKNLSQQRFAYQGFDSQKNSISGYISASNIAQAKLLLRRQGLTVTKISPHQHNSLVDRAVSILSTDITAGSSHKVNNIFAKKSQSKDTIALLQQLATMLHAGIALLTCFEVLLSNNKKHQQYAMLVDIRQQLVMGTPLHTAMSCYPKNFNAITRALVDAGEQSGTLAQMLTNAYQTLHHQQTLKQKTKQALRYPLIVMIVGTIVAGLLTVFLLPNFQNIYQSFNSTLPSITLIFMSVADTLREYFVFIIFGILACVCAAILSYKKYSSVRLYCARILLTIPFVGSIHKHTMHIHFCNILASTYKAGVPLLDSVSLAISATNNKLLATKETMLLKRIQSGSSISDSLQKTELFSAVTIQMIAIGEQSGQLNEMLITVADLQQEQLQQTNQKMLSLIEPISTIFIGVLIFVVLISLFLPIFNTSSLM